MPLNRTTKVQGAIFDLGGARFNVKGEGFYARGGGTIDDSPYILDALTRTNTDPHHPLQSGGELFIPTDTYKLGSTVALADVAKVAVRGTGTGTVLKPQGSSATTGEANSAFVFTDCEEVIFEDLLFHGGAMTAPRLASLYGSTVTSTQLKTIYVYPGHSLQAGDDIYIGDPTFTVGITGSPPIYADAWELNQVASIDGYDSRGAIKITLVNNMRAGRTYTDRARIAQKANGYGGHGVSLTRCARAVFRNVHFVDILTTCIDVNQVSELIVDGCTFDGYTSAQADSCYFAARGFAVGGWDVARARFTNNLVKDVPGRRSAGVEIRSTEANHRENPDHSPVYGASILDWVIKGNTFSAIGSQTDTYNAHGSAVNIITGRYNADPAFSDVRRIVIEGNTSYGIGDGHYWIAAPGGMVVAANNVMEVATAGPFLNINSPYASITGNVMKQGGLSGIEVDATGTGEYAAGSAPGYIDLRGIVITDNVITDMIHAQSGNGIMVTTSSATNKPAANAPRQVIIANNYINGCWQDGIHFTEPKGDILIQGNVILDCNQGTLASTTLTADTVSVASGQQQITVASTAHFVPLQFLQMGASTLSATTLNGATSVGATSFVVASATGIATGHALWLGIAESNTAEIVVPTNVVGTTVSCAALTLAHANGVAISSTYRPQVVSVDDATHLTLQYNQGIWASGTAVGSPFPGTGGVVLAGSATYPGARIAILNNRIGQDTAGSTQYGVSYGSGFVGPVTTAGNIWDDCVLGGERTVGTMTLYSDNPKTGMGGSAVHVAAASFTETAVAGVYTATVTLPAESTLLDIKVRNAALWTNDTAAIMKVGDELDDDGWFTGIDLRATDLLVGEEINFENTGGKEGAYLVPADGKRLRAYQTVPKAITGIVTTTGATGTAGRARMMVVYATVPLAAAAVKV